MPKYPCEECIAYPGNRAPCPNKYCIHEYTPMPWIQHNQIIKTSTGQIIVDCQAYDDSPPISGAERDRNAEFVMRACINHEELIAALLDLFNHPAFNMYRHDDDPKTDSPAAARARAIVKEVSRG